jgi:hypothetical protein
VWSDFNWAPDGTYANSAEALDRHNHHGIKAKLCVAGTRQSFMSTQDNANALWDIVCLIHDTYGFI